MKLSIQWGQAAADKQPPGTVPLNPSLTDRRLASTSWHQLGPNDSASDASMGLLSAIEMLPSTLESDAQSWSPPLILIVRSHVGSPDSPYQETQSTIDRWQVLTDQKQSVHPAFLSLGGQRQNSAPELPVRPAHMSVASTVKLLTASAQTTTRLRRQESITFNKAIVGLQPITQGKVVCVTFADGTVEYRDRLTMAEIYAEPNTERVMSMHQVGFSFTDPSPCKLCW